MKSLRRTLPLVLLALTVLALLSVPTLAAEAEEHGGDTTENVFKWINFVTVVVAGIYFFGKPTKNYLGEKYAAIRKDIGESQRQKSDAEARIAEVERKLSRLGEETERLRVEARNEIAAQLQRIRDGARNEAERILEMAHAEIATSRRAAGIELRTRSSALAIQLAEERLRKQLTPATHAKLFQSFLSGIEGRS